MDWGQGTAVMRKLIRGAADDEILEAVMRAGKAGIDCPLGWPAESVALISAHQTGQVDITADAAGRDGRRRLAWRLTDEVVRGQTGLIPLSVAADRLGHTAIALRRPARPDGARAGWPIAAETALSSRSTQRRRSRNGGCRTAATSGLPTPRPSGTCWMSSWQQPRG
jgi:hypothetical protein